MFRFIELEMIILVVVMMMFDLALADHCKIMFLTKLAPLADIGWL